MRLILLAIVVLTCMAGPVRAQVPVTKEPPALQFRIIAGRMYARADLRALEKSVAAHLLVDLGRPGPLDLHQNTAGLLELESGQELDIEFGDHTAADIQPDVSRLRFLEYLTMEYARELEEVPVVGILGVGAFRGARLRIDYQKNKLWILPRKEITGPENDPEPAPEAEPAPEKPAAKVYSIPMTVDVDYYRFKVVVDGKRVLDAAPGTGEADTWISAGMAEHLGHAGGDVESACLGDLDISKYVALRPGDNPDGFPGQPDMLLGNNLLSHFLVTLDPHHKTLELEEVRAPKFPAEEQACFKALAARDADGLEAFLGKHEKHRLALDAGTALLRIRLEASPLEEASLNRAVELYAKTTPAKRRSRMVLDLVKRMVTRRPEVYRIIRKTALDIALKHARMDEDPSALHKARSEIGGLLLEKGEVREAYRHLLSAAFGLPRDGMINLRLGKLYEKKGMLERAWSRFLQAAITEEGGPGGLEGMKRLADKKGVRTPYDVDEMEKLLEGRVPAYQPASTYAPEDGKRPTRTVLAELFTAVGGRACPGADLAFEGMAVHFAHGEVAVLQHHLMAPLSSPAALRRAQRLGVRGVPRVILDARVPVARVGGPPEKAAREFRKVIRAVEERLKSATPWTLDVTGKVDKGKVSVSVTVKGPEVEDFRLRLFLCEKTVMFPGRNKMVLHRYVTRFDMARGGIPIPSAAGARTLTRDVSLSQVMDELDDHLDAVEDRENMEFPLRPTEVAPRQVAVVAILEDGGGAVKQAGTWEAVAGEREN